MAASESIEAQFHEHFKDGRLASYPLWDYWGGVDGKTGDLGYEWSDKPHRLVFDLLHHAVAQAATITALRDRVAEVERERDVALEDRARFPDKPDTIGHMISAHIGNLKAGKESSDQFANQWHARMVAAEARAEAAEAAIARLRDAVIALKSNQEPQE